MKKVLLVGSLIICMGVSSYSLAAKTNKVNNKPNNKPKMAFHASYKKIDGLKELKEKGTTIVEVVGTDKYKIVDYKGIPFRVSTVKVTEVLKGDNQLSEINILQTEGLDTEAPPANGEKLLMFLRDSGESVGGFNSLYTPLGGSQGMYKIKVKNNKKYLEPHYMINDTILKDLSGDFNDVKIKIKK